MSNWPRIHKNNAFCTRFYEICDTAWAVNSYETAKYKQNIEIYSCYDKHFTTSSWIIVLNNSKTNTKRNRLLKLILILHVFSLVFFLNQVGGHTRLLLLNQSTVIKPLNIRELDFYQNIPSDIQQFVPKYKGKSICGIFYARH